VGASQAAKNQRQEKAHHEQKRELQERLQGLKQQAVNPLASPRGKR